MAGLLAAVRAARRALAADGPVRQRADGDFERVALPEEDGDVLRDLLVAEEARVVIEVGLAYGSSALAIAEALVMQGRDAGHVIIDAYQQAFDDAGWEAVASAGLAGLATLSRERSQLELPRLARRDPVLEHAREDGEILLDVDGAVSLSPFFRRVAREDVQGRHGPAVPAAPAVKT